MDPSALFKLGTWITCLCFRTAAVRKGHVARQSFLLQSQPGANFVQITGNSLNVT